MDQPGHCGLDAERPQIGCSLLAGVPLGGQPGEQPQLLNGVSPEIGVAVSLADEPFVETSSVFRVG